jgi:hypothetical protein
MVFVHYVENHAMLLAILLGYFLCSDSFRGRALASGMCVWTFGNALRIQAYGYGVGHVFVESISYVGMQRSDRKRKGCKDSRKGREKERRL